MMRPGVHKVLVVDDSAFMRKIITDMIMEDPEFTVIDTARNGVEAVKKARDLNPDLITMDVEMPLMNGLQALQAIMRECPVPVVMLSSLTDAGARETIAALELGAVDFVKKPSGSISLDLYKVKQQLLDKLKAAARAKLPGGEQERRQPSPVESESAPVRIAADPEERGGAPPGKIGQLVAIGTSTGGPRALQTVLSALPADFPAPVVIVQHMPPSFTKSLAERLNSLCAIRVKEAEEGMILEPATAYVAPGGWHMHVQPATGGGCRIRLSHGEPRNGHRPSVDVLFESVAELAGVRRVAVIMTGMGSDGARGLKKLRDAGAVTIAESENTSVVYGMPRAAAEMGAARFILDLHDIADKLTELTQEG